MSARVARACLLLVGLSIPVVSLADWPRFRGPTGMGVSTAKGVPLTWGPDRNLVWKRELPGAGGSSPVVFRGRIYLTSYTGYQPGQPGGMDDLKRQVFCLDAATGKPLWEKEVPSRLPESERIREEHGYATSTPAIDAERIYVFFGKSGVFAFDHDGQQLWHADVGSGLSEWGSAASPTLLGDLVLINASVESKALVALDKKTGKEVWRAGGINESWHAPLPVQTADGHTEIIVAIMGKVLAFDPANGQQLWSCNTDIPWYMVPGPVAHDGIVYFLGGRPGSALAVRTGGRGDVTNSHRLWTSRKGSNVSSPIFEQGRLYWAHDQIGVVYCADARSGKILYEERLDRADQIYASPVLVEGKLIYLARTGRAFVVAAGPRFELLETNEPLHRGVFDASPAVLDGRLLIRAGRYLYCLGQK